MPGVEPWSVLLESMCYSNILSLSENWQVESALNIWHSFLPLATAYTSQYLELPDAMKSNTRCSWKLFHNFTVYFSCCWSVRSPLVPQMCIVDYFVLKNSDIMFSYHICISKPCHSHRAFSPSSFKYKCTSVPST